MKKPYISPEFDVLDLLSTNFLSLSPETPDDEDIPNIPGGGSAGDDLLEGGDGGNGYDDDVPNKPDEWA